METAPPLSAPSPAGGDDTYDVKQGRTKLKMTVSAMGLQLFKGAKPVETLLYQNMRGWADENGDTLVVGNLGDSRAVLKRGRAEAVRLSTDHSPKLPAEHDRILSLGGIVSRGRVHGILAVSRAMLQKGILK